MFALIGQIETQFFLMPESIATSFGWLFGLMGPTDLRVEIPGLTIRSLTSEERAFVQQSSDSAFLNDWPNWRNSLELFPYVYERSVPKNSPIGSWDPVAIALSLLGIGELRAPVQWQIDGNTRAAAVGGHDAIEMMLRFSNGRLQPMRMNVDVIPELVPHVAEFIRSASNPEWLEPFVIDRMFAAKAHILQQGNDHSFIARAADLCLCLEYIFNERVTSEVKFRLSASIAWMLETTTDDRSRVVSWVGRAYDLRSAHVHGGRAKRLKDGDRHAVYMLDVLLRRVLIARTTSKRDNESWIETVKDARLGRQVSDIDRAGWLVR